MEQMSLMVSFLLRSHLRTLRELPYGSAQLLRSKGAELLAHKILLEFRRTPSLKSVTLEGDVAGSPPCVLLKMSYVANDDVELDLSDELINESFAGELFGKGRVTISADNPVIIAALGEIDLYNEYLPTVSYIATLISGNFLCSADRD